MTSCISCFLSLLFLSCTQNVGLLSVSRGSAILPQNASWCVKSSDVDMIRWGHHDQLRNADGQLFLHVHDIYATNSWTDSKNLKKWRIQTKLFFCMTVKIAIIDWTLRSLCHFYLRPCWHFVRTIWTTTGKWEAIRAGDIPLSDEFRLDFSAVVYFAPQRICHWSYLNGVSLCLQNHVDSHCMKCTAEHFNVYGWFLAEEKDQPRPKFWDKKWCRNLSGMR